MDLPADIRIGLGLAALGRPGYINIGHGRDLGGKYEVREMEQRAFRVLDEAYRLGVRYFDAARSYGKAEQFLSSWIRTRRISADEITVGSKWGYQYTADWKIDADVHEQKEHSIDRLNDQWAETKSFLGEHIDLYQIHSATFESGVLSNVPVLTRLSSMKAQGVAIGLSVSGPRQRGVLDDALTVEVDGIKLFDSVQATWNILEQSSTDVLTAAHDSGVRVIVKEALANGRLASNSHIEKSEASLSGWTQVAEFMHVGIDTLSLAVVLAQPWADCVLSGAATEAHLTSNFAATQLRLESALLHRTLQFAEDPEEYWQRRSQLAWN